MNSTEASPRPKLWTRNYMLGVSSNFFLSASFYGVTPVLPVLLTQQGQAENVGLVMGIFSVSMILMRFLGGWLSDNLGRKKVGLIALFFLASITAAYMLAGSMGLIMMLALRLCHGAMQGLSATAVGSLVAISVPKDRKGEGMSYAGAFGMASTAIMPFVGLKIFQESTFVWGISIAVSAALAFTCIFLMRVKTPSVRKPFKMRDLVMQDKRVLYVAISIIGVALTHGAISAYIPVYAKENHISTSVVGAFFFVYAAVTFLSRTLVGKKLDQRGCFTFVHPCLFAICAGIILLTTIPSTFALLAAAVLVAGGVGTINLSLLTYALKSTPDEKAGAVNSTYYTAYEFGILGGGLLAFIANWTGFTHMWWAVFPFLAVTAFLTRKLRFAV